MRIGEGYDMQALVRERHVSAGMDEEKIERELEKTEWPHERHIAALILFYIIYGR